MLAAVILGLQAASAAVLSPVTAQRQHCAVHSRRAVLAAVPTLFWATSAFAADEAASAETAPQQPPLASSEPATVEYADLVDLLKDCRSTGVCAVERVDFLSASGDSAVAYIGGTGKVQSPHQHPLPCLRHLYRSPTVSLADNSRGTRNVRLVAAMPACPHACTVYLNRLQSPLHTLSLGQGTHSLGADWLIRPFVLCCAPQTIRNLPPDDPSNDSSPLKHLTRCFSFSPIYFYSVAAQTIRTLPNFFWAGSSFFAALRRRSATSHWTTRATTRARSSTSHAALFAFFRSLLFYSLFLLPTKDLTYLCFISPAQTISNLPPDDPSNDSSPLKLVAKCRDASVPFTFSSIQAAIKATKGSSVLSVLPALPKIF
jgi:hypothetical protein